MDSVSVHRIEFDIPWPPDTAYAYLVDGDEPVLVDAGAPGEESTETLRHGLAEAGYELADIEHLLITHPHTDHGGQAATIVEAADPTVYTLAGVGERLARDPDDLAAAVRANATDVGVPDPEDEVDRAVDSLRRNRDCLPPEHIDIELAPGESVDAGGATFEAIHVPGHQENQAAFRLEDLLFAGDTAVEPFRPAALHVGLDDGSYEAIDAFHRGLDALEGVAPEIERVFPGHGPVFEDLERVVERDRESLEGLAEDCRAALNDLSEATPYEVTEARVENLEKRRYTIFESVGALARLERQGVIESTADDGRRRYHLKP
ncbi:MAG: glyoxylase-like metal-dependent hydrolase (beta-lactamase superfamily II) [Natronomonas sp.]|jgi:glyoxylase-like metal-dependent hydrolase (beta-lactamase superfamily II)